MKQVCQIFQKKKYGSRTTIWDCFFPSEKVGSGPLENRRTRNGTNVMISSSSMYDCCVRITGIGSAADLMEWT